MWIHFLAGLRSAVCLSLIAVFWGPAIARAADSIRVSDPWAKATVAGQTVGGVYMQIVSPRAARLVGVNSPLARAAEVHSMTMDGGTMRMRAVGALDLPAGTRVDLAPGGYHIMLFDLKKPLLAGQKVPLTLLIEEKGERVRKIAVNAIVRAGDHHDGADGHQ
ncbi:MAG TPA: copper chaperone PCu(A)C [Burkholderiales bacterium]|nr:copper chaperone PCu(A)C [Burkholderiales bacterium]